MKNVLLDQLDRSPPFIPEPKTTGNYRIHNSGTEEKT